MRGSDGTHHLVETSTGATSSFAINGNHAVATYDTFTYNVGLDIWVADHLDVTIKFQTPTTGLGTTGNPPNPHHFTWDGP